jgi:transcriptional regulator with XRE-family HTH domain
MPTGTLRKKLAANLRVALREKGISVERFAYETGISKGYMYDVANAKANVTLDKLEKIAAALKKSAEKLIS